VSVSSRNAPYWLATFDELRRLGFIEGQNLTIDWRDYGQRIDLVSKFVTDLVKAHVDVIYVGGDTAIRAAQQATANRNEAAADRIGLPARFGMCWRTVYCLPMILR
jgi:hypothetical protein